ncbi:MAG: hypothetical protein AAF697_03140 [Pseudomonadota bacterium]
MSRLTASTWQLILADLALILFLVTLSALAHEEEADTLLAQETTAAYPEVAPSQALFRPNADGPELGEWLANRPPDNRATLTIFAQHSAIDREVMWQKANALAGVASEQGFAVRVVITRGEVSDLHASLAYDSPE